MVAASPLAPIHKLPDGILLKIFTFAGDPSDEHYPGFLPKKHIDILDTVRWQSIAPRLMLVCRQWRYIVTPLLYRTIRVDIRGDKREFLRHRTVSERPSLCLFPRNVRISKTDPCPFGGFVRIRGSNMDQHWADLVEEYTSWFTETRSLVVARSLSWTPIPLAALSIMPKLEFLDMSACLWAEEFDHGISTAVNLKSLIFRDFIPRQGQQVHRVSVNLFQEYQEANIYSFQG